MKSNGSKYLLHISLISIPVRMHDSDDGDSVRDCRSSTLKANRDHRVRRELGAGWPIAEDDTCTSVLPCNQGNETRIRGRRRRDDDGWEPIVIDTIVPAARIHPMDCELPQFCLTAEGSFAEFAYQIVLDEMRNHETVAIGYTNWRGRKTHVAIRTAGCKLVVTNLDARDVSSVTELFGDHSIGAYATREEIHLTRTLLQAFERNQLDVAIFQGN